MGAGFNIRVNVWHVKFAKDDSVGGAVPTGTVVYHDIMAKIQQEPVEMLLMQQGLETEHVYKMNIIPGTLAIYERDEIEISKPLDHPYYGQKFRVKNVQYSSHNPRDSRNYIMLTLTRSDRMHEQQ
jgi:hypothetical protein